MQFESKPSCHPEDNFIKDLLPNFPIHTALLPAVLTILEPE